MTARPTEEPQMKIVVSMRKIFSWRFAGASMLSSALLLILLLTLLGGCGLFGDSATSAFVEPGKYVYYNCDQLAANGRTLSAREQELTDLMARAAQGPAGEFIGKVTYRTELIQARGMLKQINEVSVQKNCTSQSKWQSDRALW